MLQPFNRSIVCTERSPTSTAFKVLRQAVLSCDLADEKHKRSLTLYFRIVQEDTVELLSSRVKASNPISCRFCISGLALPRWKIVRTLSLIVERDCYCCTADPYAFA